MSGRTSMLSGKAYIIEVLLGNPTRCYESFRMSPHVFMNLCNRLKVIGLLQDKRNVSVEGVAMRLVVLCHSTCQRIAAERFQHSLGTVHKWTEMVIWTLASLGTHLIEYVNRGQVQQEILSNPKRYSYFEKCIGAIDGTHVAAWCPASKQKTFRGRKATLVTQNVMAVCSHDMMFTYVYTGWEGMTNNSRVFLDALTRQGNRFSFPLGGKI